MKTRFTVDLARYWLRDFQIYLARNVFGYSSEMHRTGPLEWWLSDSVLMDLMKENNLTVPMQQVTGLCGYRVNRSRDGKLNELVRLSDVGVKMIVSTLTLLSSRAQEKPDPGYLIEYVDLRRFNPKIGVSPEKILL